MVIKKVFLVILSIFLVNFVLGLYTVEDLPTVETALKNIKTAYKGTFVEEIVLTSFCVTSDSERLIKDILFMSYFMYDKKKKDYILYKIKLFDEFDNELLRIELKPLNNGKYFVSLWNRSSENNFENIVSFKGKLFKECLDALNRFEELLKITNKVVEIKVKKENFWEIFWSVNK